MKPKLSDLINLTKACFSICKNSVRSQANEIFSLSVPGIIEEIEYVWLCGDSIDLLDINN